MTRIMCAKNGQKVLVIEPESEGACELCGKTAELRPYGPGGKNICFECGDRHEPETMRRCRERMRKLMNSSVRDS